MRRRTAPRSRSGARGRKAPAPEQGNGAGRPRPATRGLGLLLVGSLLVGSMLVGSLLGAAPLHTYLTGSEPAADSVVPMPVTELRLSFSTPVQRALSTVTVTGADGFSVPTGRVMPVPGAEDDELQVVFREPLPEGSYTVRWRTVGPDDHPVQGTFSFRVGEAAPDDPLDIAEEVLHQEDEHAGMEHDAPGAGELQERESGGSRVGADARLQLAVRWLFYLSVLGMIGTVTFRLTVVQPISRLPELRDLGVRALARTRSLAALMAVLALIVLLPRLFLQAVAIFGSIRPAQLGTIVFQTGWGLVWLFQAFFTLLFVGGLAATGPGGRRARGWAVMAFGAFGMAFIPAASGHAWGAEAMRATAVASTSVHVLAGGIWLGGLMTLVLAGLPSLRRQAREVAPDDDSAPERRAGFVGLSSMVNAFSRVAILAVAMLVATGLITAWVHLDTFGDLIVSGYGRTLAVKVAAAFCAFALGFYNWKVVRPALRERQDRGLLRIPASLELFIGLLVLIVTAALVSQALP